MSTVMRVEKSVHITDPSRSSRVKLTAVVEKATAFTHKRLAYYEVTECPAPVWRFVFEADPQCTDRGLVNELVVSGWDVTITSRIVETGWAHFLPACKDTSE